MPWLKEAEKGNTVDQKAIAWMKTKLAANLQSLERLKNNGVAGFSWGDIQSAVLVERSGKMHFYDFEHASISCSPGLAYVKIHGKFSAEQFNYFLERYALYSHKTKTELSNEIAVEEKIIRVNDVVWAAMQWASTGERQFKRLTYRRMVLADQLDA